ncbi:cytochrome c [Sinimarinibacterium sp. CAU 1509]|uniref:c-type cytochrome n=1 Tax=Sinimarinibacterium sp. CAU 1509 TaxID=2562283 RepID=UPI0010ACA67E|nr:cytochrome c [Sinimarinibacterium sp. CAU 1509]TJY58837.1 cytochrome c [Sinimarinibacterium sp. CAU 1509]
MGSIRNVCGSGLILMLAMTQLPALADDAGAALYAKRCALCHQPHGEGLAGRYPPLTGLQDWVASAEGRAYLSQVVVNGLKGPIMVEGQPYNALMWTFKKRLTDPELVAVLRYVAESLNAPSSTYQPFDTATITAARSASGRDADMLAVRAQLPPR